MLHIKMCSYLVANMNEEIDLTPPGRPMALGSRGEMEEEAAEIAKKLKTYNMIE